MTLAKSGYYAGNPDYIYASDVQTVIDTYQYEMFMRDYETTYHELNTRKITNG